MQIQQQYKAGRGAVSINQETLQDELCKSLPSLRLSLVRRSNPANQTQLSFWVHCLTGSQPCSLKACFLTLSSTPLHSLCSMITTPSPSGIRSTQATSRQQHPIHPAMMSSC